MTKYWNYIEGTTTVGYADNLVCNLRQSQIEPKESGAITLKEAKRREAAYFPILCSQIESKEQVKYLGVILDKNLTFDAHVKHILKKNITLH